jgi:uncharacterized phosphatase
LYPGVSRNGTINRNDSEGEINVRLLLIRHGQSEGNVQGIIQGQMDFALSERGKAEASALGEWLKEYQIHAFYASDLERAYQTALAVAKHHRVDVIRMKELREFNLGPLQGLTRAEMREKYPQLDGKDWFSAGIEGVETLDALRKRADTVIETLFCRHRGQTVVAVSHGGFISTILMNLLQVNWNGRRAFAIDNTGISTIEFMQPKQFTIFGVNETAHLSLTMDQQKPGTRAG